MSLWASKMATRTLKKIKALVMVEIHSHYRYDSFNFDVGYGDGFLRLNENHNYTTPKGFQVLGHVSMDNLSINSDEEEVCLFDDVRELAKIHNTITYEITCSLKESKNGEIIKLFTN